MELLPLDSIGKKLDPNLHQAMMEIEMIKKNLAQSFKKFKKVL